MQFSVRFGPRVSPLFCIRPYICQGMNSRQFSGLFLCLTGFQKATNHLKSRRRRRGDVHWQIFFLSREQTNHNSFSALFYCIQFLSGLLIYILKQQFFFVFNKKGWSIWAKIPKILPGKVKKGPFPAFFTLSCAKILILAALFTCFLHCHAHKKMTELI